MSRHARDVNALQLDNTTRCFHTPRNQIEQRRFTRAIRPNQCMSFALANAQIDAAQDLRCIKTFGDVGEFERNVHGRFLTRYVSSVATAALTIAISQGPTCLPSKAKPRMCARPSLCGSN